MLVNEIETAAVFRPAGAPQAGPAGQATLLWVSRRTRTGGHPSSGELGSSIVSWDLTVSELAWFRACAVLLVFVFASVVFFPSALEVLVMRVRKYDAGSEAIVTTNSTRSENAGIGSLYP